MDKVNKLARKLMKKDLKRVGWRLVAVWGYYRDKAERELNKN